MDPVDVLVHGGGPAGAATALALARGGRSVALLVREQPGRGRPPFGETVPAEILRPLCRLGLWDEFRAAGHLPAPGTLVSWGRDRPHENESVFNPYGHDWHLDRVRFDRMLRDAAVAAGARPVPAGTPVPPARLVVDATGRAARLARRRGAARHLSDRQVGLVRFGPATARDPRTVIEACRQGWWYAAELPHGGGVTALFTDADLLPSGAGARARLWDEALAGTHLVRDVTAPAATSRVWVAPAQTGGLTETTGDGWVAVGDAARTLDPLSGRGLLTALWSAVETAGAVLGPRPAAALADLARDGAREHRTHLRRRGEHYRRERRWPHSPFWARRHEQIT